MKNSSETAYDKAIRKMGEREARILNGSSIQTAASVAEQIKIQQTPLSKALQTLQDTVQPYYNLISTDALSNSMIRSLTSADAILQQYQNMDPFLSDVLAALETATITPELRDFRAKLEISAQAMDQGLLAISDYIDRLTLQWSKALAITDVLERSIAAQNLAVIRVLPAFENWELPRGGKSVLRAMTKSTAKKLMQSTEIQFDAKEKDFYHKDSPENKLSANQITVVASSLELFEEFSLDDLLSFESKLEQNFAFASRHPVGSRIYEILKNWNCFVNFEDIIYYHARTLDEHRRPYLDSEMMKAPVNVSPHGRYNEVGRSCYYVAESKKGALNEIYKHCGGRKPCVQVIGLRAIKSVKLLDLSAIVRKTNIFIEHMRFTVENEAGRTVQEYLLPNYVASCCKELGIGGIRYKSAGYNCCVLWRDDYFEHVEGSREVIPGRSS